MSVKPPERPPKSDTYLNVLGLMGLLRVSMFEAFGDRRFWDEQYYDLFTGMLVKQLRGSVSTMEEMTGSMTGISHSTKIRMIEEARASDIIVAVNRSEIELDQPLETTSARKVFFLSQESLDRMTDALNSVIADIRDFAEQNRQAAPVS
ncbi:MAG: hypothetical protein AAF439_07585 [Pseudomonadota bacterium]